MDRRSEASAAATLDRLPARGEAFHVISGGNWHGFSLVPLCCNLIAPAVIDELVISTLSFNSGNTDRLVELLDSGAVRSVAMLASVYFRDTSRREYGELAAKLAERGHRLAAVRTHAKIIAMRTTAEDHVVIESSANLRSCRNAEQYTMMNDAALFAFHRSWIADLIQKAEADQ